VLGADEETKPERAKRLTLYVYIYIYIYMYTHTLRLQASLSITLPPNRCVRIFGATAVVHRLDAPQVLLEHCMQRRTQSVIVGTLS